jgi:hypothetical protein
MTTPAPSRIRSIVALRISLAAGLLILVLTVLSALREPVRPCGDLPSGYAPIIAFELARTADDLAAIFGPPGDPCRAGVVEAMDAINWIDVLAFIPLYGAFMIFFFAGMRERDGRLARLGIWVSVVAVLGDYAENACLMHLTPALDPASIWLALLPWATAIKWVALGVAAGIAALIYARASDRRAWHILAAIGCFVSLLVSLAAMASPHRFGPMLSPAIGVSWLTFLVTALLDSFAGNAARRATAVR